MVVVFTKLCVYLVDLTTISLNSAFNRLTDNG